jgi:hypothetical protein
MKQKHGILARPSVAVSILLILLSTALVSCAGANASAGSSIQMASVEQLPDEVQGQPETVVQAYQFAVANPEILSHIPCYCGCGSMGHTSNYACYVQEMQPDGTIVYDSHALGCSICVDITQDTMRLLTEGKSVSEIRSYVDETYAQYGPSNILP